MPLEIEVKFLLQDPEQVRMRLVQLGARSRGRHFEANLRFDDKRRTLLQRQCLLRLRKDRRFLLTFKERSPESDAQFKVHRELEVEVADFDQMQQILAALGFEPVQRYEKWRETFRRAGTDFCLDTLPFGRFLEIEGEKDDIRQAADLLGLEWRHRILDNYLRIFERLKEKEGFAFSDLTFENFKGLKTGLGALAAELEAGN